MPWQDVVLTVGNIVFIAALVPSLISKDKPHLLTSLPTATVLFSFALVYYSLDLNASAFIVFVSGMVWLALGLQKKFSKKL